MHRSNQHEAGAFGAARQAVAAAALCLVLAACGAGTKVTISPDYRDGDATYTLLYSTVGYESAATKQVLIRQNDTGAPIQEGLQFAWRLVDAHGNQAGAGRAAYSGTTWGIPLWMVDFSKVTSPGTYRLLAEALDTHIATEPFVIDRFLLFNKTFSPMALDGSEGRAAPIELDNGYYDSNSITGGASSHAEFLYGLLESYARRNLMMDDAQRTRLRAAIDRAIDYMVLIGDPGSGQLNAEASSRPFNNSDPQNTAEGVRAMAHFAAVFKKEEPDKAERAFQRAKQSERWLLANAAIAYPKALEASVAYDFYTYAGDKTSLDRAAAAVRAVAATYDLRTMDRPSSDTLPHFEAMYRMWRELPSHADEGFWLDTAKRVAEQYKAMLATNAFAVIPPGTTDADRSTDAAAQWDNVANEPPPGDNGSDALVSNGWFLARAIDATYLAEMTKDPQLMQVATGSIEWILGVNPGVPSEHVAGAHTQSPVAAASFLTGIAARQAQGWSEWQWSRTTPFATILNGFRAGFTFDDSDKAGDSSLRYDGVWLYATLVYEDYLNRGKRAPAVPESSASAPGVRVSGVQPTSSPELLQVLVSVAGPDGQPLAGAVVDGAWSGTPLPDHGIDEGVHVSECTTGGTGSCVLVLNPDSLPVTRPISVAVTNVQQPRYVYDLAHNATPITATFP